MSRKLGPILLVLILVGIAAFLIVQYQESRSALHPIRVALRQQLAPRRLPDFVRYGNDSVAWRLRTFYKKHGYQPVWVDGNGPTRRAPELVKAVLQLRDEGLDPLDYHLERIQEMLGQYERTPLAPKRNPRQMATLEILLSHSFLTAAAHELAGRVNPNNLPADWHARPRRSDWMAVMQNALGPPGIQATLDRLRPPHEGYQRLKEALARYRKIAEAGGWPTVPGGTRLKRGNRGARVMALERRLIASGDLNARSGLGTFDGSVEAAVRRFQARLGLEETGKVGPSDLVALNVPVQARIQQIELNLERWRWLPATLGDRYIIVNVPDFTLRIYEGGRPRWSTRVVVGKDYSRTPIFSDTLTYVVFNPDWNVPASIVGLELADSIRQDPGYLERNHMRVFDGPGENAHEVDPSGVNWSAATDADFRYSVRQDPGPGNALGRIKFVFPNRFNIYFHDTPAGRLFSQRERDFSHGCIRVENPDALAEYLLQGKSGWGSGALAAAYDTSVNRSVTIPKPIPVHIVYWTAWVDENGILQFRDDIYGIDAVLDQALHRQSSR